VLRSNENNFTAPAWQRGLLAAALLVIIGCGGEIAGMAESEATPQVAARAAAPTESPAPTFGVHVAEPAPESPRPTRANVSIVTSPPAAPRAIEPAALPAAPTPASGPAADIVARTNALRTGRGLASLGRDAGLDAAALAWARSMAASGVLAHSNLPNQVLGQPWTSAGENVGYGPSVQVVHDALVASPGHLANIVGAKYRVIGVGAVLDASGRLWVAQLFAG